MNNFDGYRDLNKKDENKINKALKKSIKKTKPIDFFIADEAIETQDLRTFVDFLEYKILEIKDPELFRLIEKLIYLFKDRIFINDIFNKNSTINQERIEVKDDSYDFEDIDKTRPKEYMDIVGYSPKAGINGEFFNELFRKEEEINREIKDTSARIKYIYPIFFKVLEEQRKTFKDKRI